MRRSLLTCKFGKNTGQPFNLLTTQVKHNVKLYTLPNFWSRYRMLAMMMLMLSAKINAQVSVTNPGNTTPAMSATYTTLALAIADVNNRTAISGPVTITLTANQTAPAGGYSITNTSITGGSNTNRFILNGGGNTITAPATQVSGSLNDAIFKIIGADFINIQNFTMQENAANTTTTAASNNMTEFGVALFYSTTTNGAQNNTIQNNTITLNRTYQNTFGIYSNTRHSATNISSTAEVTSAAGANSNNKFYGNTISNVNMGIALIGAAATAVHDLNNDIGGSSSTTGNTITNWGGAGASSGYISNSGTSYCIFVNHQDGENVSYNTITSAALSGTAVTTVGIRKDYTTTSPAGTFTSSITNNTITLNSGFTSGILQCILSQGITTVTLSTATININNNTILNCTVTGTASSTSIEGIVNSSASGVLSISNNIFRGNTSSATTGGFTAISNTGQVVTTTNINNNQVGNASDNAITFSAATSGAVNGISNWGGLSTCTTTIQGNDFRGIVHSVAGTSAHTYITQRVAVSSANVNGNTFTNLSVNTTGAVVFVDHGYAIPATGQLVINNNSIVTAFTRLSAGSITITTSNASSGTGSVCNYTNNNFSNIIVPDNASGNIIGFNNTDGGTGSTKTITGNTFNNWHGGTTGTTGTSGSINCMNITYWNGVSSLSNNTITNITGRSSITGVTIGSAANNATSIAVSSNTINNLASIGTGGSVTGISCANTSTTININGNVINTLSSTGSTTFTGIVSGIIISGATTTNVFANKIYNLSGNNASTTVNGLSISSGTTINAYNNLIADLRATAANAANPIVGLNISGGTTVNASFNSVYLNASSSGTLFGSSAVSVSTTPTVTLRNNIFVNLSSVTGAGLAVAHRRSSATLTTYSSSSNNNLFFTNSTYYTDGLTPQATFAAYKTAMATRDQASVSENPSFQSTSGSSADFLKYNTGIVTQIESGGISVSGITTDFSGTTRNVSTPDIGAWELNGVAAPSISYTVIPNTLCTNGPTLSVTITHASGVNTTAGSAPRLYYKKSTDNNTYAGNTSTNNGWKFVESASSSSPFSFTIDGSLLRSAVAAGDVIQYFVVAQDNAGTPNVGLNSGIFAAAPSSVALTSAAFPLTGTINSYTIGTAIPTSVTIGASGTYTSITGTGGLFAAINAGGLSGNTVANIIGASVTETGAIVLNEVLYGCTPNATLTIKPQTTATLTGTSSGALIRLNGADNIIIDGSNNGTNSRNLTITNTNAGTSSAVIWLQSSGTNGATSNTIKNCNIVGNAPTTTLMGIGSGGSSISATSLGTNNNNNTFENNNISKVQYAIYSQGNSAGTKNSGNIITQNLINTASPNQVSKSGILAGFENNITISNNNISNISGVSSSYAWAINLGALTSITTTAPSTGNEVTNATVSANVIGSIRAASTYGAGGIIISPSTSGINLIANNMIFDVAANGTTGDCGIGIMVAGGIGSTSRVYHNSVSMSATLTSGNGPNIALAVSNNPVIDIRNNVLASTGSTGTGPNRAIALSYSTYTNLTSNYNNLFVSGGGTTAGVGAIGGWAGTAQVALSNWQSTTSKDANSISSNPLFTSNTNLIPTNGSPLVNAGTPIAGITTDYRGATRNNTTPTIGAIEIANCTAPVAQPTSMLFSAIGTGQMTISFTPVAGTGIRHLVVRYPNAATPTNPSNGTTYALGATLGSGTVVSSGSNTSRVVTGLSPNTTYDYYVYSFNDTICLNGPTYNTNSPLSGSQSTNPCPTLNATVTIGQTGADYSSLTDALLILSGCGITQPTTLELQPDYISTGETFPITFGNITGANSTNTITIRPAAAVSAPLLITSNNATGTILHNQSSFFVFDGRPGGTGTSKMLTIENTSSSGYALNYQNESSNNTLRYLLIESANTGTTSGTIVFSTTTGANGNDNNTIEYCDIYSFDAATATPTNAIYAAGSTGTAAANNNNITISNNNIYDFYSSTSTTQISGINISSGNSDWTISNNSFYQTQSRTTFGSGVTFNAILIANSSGNNFVITGNNIGGTQPLCGGTPLTLNTTATLVFRAIQLTAGATTATSIQENTIRNIAITTASTSTTQSAISLVTGSFNCGNITGNTIGSQTTTGSITFTQSTTSTAVIFSGILAGTGTPGAINISNNLIGGIAVSNSSTGAISLRGISVQGAATSYTITNNTIGSTTLPSSLSNSTNSSILGIFSASTSLTNNISNNTIANLTNSSTGSSAQVVGLSLPGSSGGIFSATGNTVRDLTNSGANIGTAASASVIGISHTAFSSSGQVISQNTIFSLSNIGSGTSVTGIHYNGPTTGTNEVKSNLVHSLSAATAGSTISGLEIADAGNALVYNNMVRFGIDAAGNDLTTNTIINGIRQTNATSNHGIYFNSIYLGGAGVSTGANNSFAIHSSASAGTRLIRNNIFANLRANGSGTGKHYSIRISGLTGLTINNNDYWTGSNFLALNSATDVTTFSGWQTATSQDAGSVSNDPNFVNATGNTAALDLHINNSTSSVLESGGINISGITTDRDGHSRPGPTGSTNGGAISSDIGADEFDGIPGYTCSSFPSLTAVTTNATVCNNTATLSITGSIAGTGITYQWQSSATQSGTYTNIADATGATYNVPNNSVSNLWYLCQVTCANGPTTATTSSVNVDVQACNYTVTRNTAITYNSIISTGTTYTSLSDADDGITNVVSLSGTTFKYRGAAVTGFRSTSNGWMTFNTSSTSTQYDNNLGSTDFNVLAPFWDDLVIRGQSIANKDASMRYQIIGTLGSGTADIVIEWAEMERFNYGDPNVNFQVVLHEADNSIDFNYGNFQMFNGASNPSTQTWTYSVGLNGSTPATASTDQRIILQAENSSFFSSNLQNSLGYSTLCNSQYRFVPSVALSAGTAPTSGSFTASTFAPANNEVAGAVTVAVNSSPCTNYCGNIYSSKNATASSSISVCSASTPGTPDDDVFFSFTTTTASNYRISVDPSAGYNAVVQILDGSLTPVSCVNDAGAGLSELIASAALNPSSLYYLRIYDAATGSSNNGEFAICVSEVISPPANDNPSGAIVLTTSGTCTSTSSTLPATLSATGTNGITTCSAATPGTPDDDIWYTFTTNSIPGTTYAISATGVSTYNAVLQLFSGTASSLTSVDCANATGNGGTETINAGALTTNTTYFFRVYHSGSGAANGNVSVCVVHTIPTCLTSVSASVGDYIWQGQSTSFTTANNWLIYDGPSSYSVASTAPSAVNIFIPSSTCFANQPTLSSSPSAVNNLTINSGATLSLGNNTLTVNGNLTSNGTINIGNSTLVFSGTAAQNVSISETLFNLTLNNSNGLILGQNLTVSNNLNLTAGTLNIDTRSLTLNGSISRTSGNINASNATANLTFSGSSAQSIPASTFTGNINNLILNNSSGLITNQNLTFAGTLTLTAGVFDANNMVTFNNNASLIHNGGSIINYSLPTDLNNFTPITGTTTLSGNLSLSGNLNIGSNILDIGSNTLTVNGGITRTTGAIKTNLGTLILGGTTSSTLHFDQTTDGVTNKLKDLTINRTGATVTLGNKLQIADNGTVTVTAGTLATGGNLLLTSTLSGTGRIAELTVGASVTGNVEIQRYMVGGATSQRGWRYMSSPVASATYAQLIDDIFITGPGGTTNGFDMGGTNSSVMYYEESTARGWKSISSPNNTWTAGKGAIVFFRGDRTQTTSLTNTLVAPNSFALDYLGNINSGNYTVNLDYDNTVGIPDNQGWNLIGNPYPSQIDWNNVSKTIGVSSHYYLINPNTKNYVSANTGIIAVGQGFFVQVNAGSQSVTFEENDKTSSTGTAYFKTAVNPLTIKMNMDSIQHDVANIYFENNANKNYLFVEDAIKLKNSVYNLSIITPNNFEVQNNHVPFLGSTGTDTFELKVTSTINSSYNLSFTNFNQIPSNKAIVLVDKLNNSITNLRLTPNYTFTINNSISASFGKRFLLIITDQLNALPVKLIAFSGNNRGKHNELLWTTSNEKNMVSYDVQRSTDGINFETIGLIKPSNVSTTSNYLFDDYTFKNQTNFYRLKMVDSKTIEYSNTIVISNELKTNAISLVNVFPNPANKTINISIPQGAVAGLVKILDIHGKIVLETTEHEGIDISMLNTGIYMINTEINNESVSLKFVKTP